MAANDDFILELLIKHGLIQPSDMEDARRASGNNGHGSVEELVRNGLVTNLDILRTTAAEAGVDLVEKIEAVPEEAISAVPRQLAYRLSVMPLNLEGRHLRIALSDPFNFDALDTLTKELRFDIDPVVAPADQIELALKRHYGSASEMVHSLIGTYSGDRVAGSEDAAKKEDSGDDGSHGDDAHIIKLVNLMILEAHRMRTSDIHLEPLEKRLRLRYRIDGVLQVMPDPPKKLQAALVSRIKIMSDLSIAEKRLPQDGRIQMRASPMDALLIDLARSRPSRPIMANRLSCVFSTNRA